MTSMAHLRDALVMCQARLRIQREIALMDAERGVDAPHNLGYAEELSTVIAYAQEALDRTVRVRVTR